MKRYGGLKKGGKGSGRAGAAATDHRSATPGKGKFKLRTAKDPLPLLTNTQKKPLSRETKPKAKFLQLTGAEPSTEKPNTKPSIFATNSFIRPLTTDDPLKKSTGFSFMKFQPRSGDLGKGTSEHSGKATPLIFASTKPLLCKFSVNGLTKKTDVAREVGSTSARGPFKLQRSLPFAFRADTKSSTAKKRKTMASTSTLDETKNAFPNKSNRIEGNGGFAFMAHNKEKGTRVARNVEPGGGRPSSFSLDKKKSSAVTNANEGTVLKKRGLLLSSAEEEGLALKRTKHVMQNAVQRDYDNLTNNSSISRTDKSGDLHHDDALSKSSFVPQDSRPTQISSLDVDTMQLSAMPPSSPDCREDCSRSGIEDELAVKILCTLDDKEDEFLTRTAAIQDFTDRAGLEQKQLRNRLLDAHADVSESLLDALTDLMAEEGGIGIDKIAFNMNIDVDVGDAFLQEDIQVLQ